MIVIEIWNKKEKIKVINFYNPCKKLERVQLELILEEWRGKIIWCGDFNSHSKVWGEKEDLNGEIL